MANVNFATAFIAGLLSFISPCVLPLIPTYICLITGVTLDELEEKKTSQVKILLNAILFVLGFSLVFVLLGCSLGFLGNLFAQYQRVINVIMGLLVIFFALHIAGIIPISFLEKQLQFEPGKLTNNYFGSFIIGLAFAFAWTPCVGPILGSILLLASQQGTVMQGALLLICYSLGLGIPFILTALAIQTFFKFSQGIKKHYNKIKVVSGILLLIIGILILTNNFNLLRVIF